jgi:hypothetical protein
LTVAGGLLLIGLIGCAGAPAVPAGIKVQPVIPAEPVLPYFSAKFNQTAPIEDLEALGNYAAEVHAVYEILSGQLKGK